MALPSKLFFTKALIAYKQGFRGWLASTARIISTSFPLANVHSNVQKGNSAQESSAGSPQSKRGPFVSRLKSRGVIRFDGPDTIKYLQGIVTNDLKCFREPSVDVHAALRTPNQPIFSSGPIYAALLSPQGRFLYDLFLYQPVHPAEKLNTSGYGPGEDGKGSPALLFADVDADQLADLVGHLKTYRLRAKVEIQDVSKDLAAWQRFGGALADASAIEKASEAEGIGRGGSHDLASPDAAQASEQGWRWSKDPRLASLGLRGLFPSDTVPPLVEADKEVDEQYYLLWRLEEGVPEGSAEIPKGEAIPLEYNLAGLNAISFEKGCYVGQESVARTHHRGVIRKRLLPVSFIQESGEEVREAVGPKSEVIDVHSGKKVGNITTVLGSRGFALLRLEAALKSSSQLNVKGLENIQVKVVRPKWWPSEWVQEEEPRAAAA